MSGSSLFFPKNFRITTFTSSGTWTKLANLKRVIVISTGAGGGGQNSNGSGNGGQAGGTCIDFIDADDLGSTETVTIGSPGAGGSTSSGDGSATTFGSHHSAGGGQGADGNDVGGVATGATININGGETMGPDGGVSFFGGPNKWKAGALANTYGTGGAAFSGTIDIGNDGRPGICIVIEVYD